MDFPKAAGLDPRAIVPEEPRRMMPVSTDTYDLSWLQLSDRLDRTRWLLVATSRRSISSLANTAQQIQIKLRFLELRAFALARVSNSTEAMVAWTAPDGCDVVLVKDATPVEHQSIFWGAELVEDTVLWDRLTEVIGRTINTFNTSSPEGTLSEEAPLFDCYPPMRLEPEIGTRVANNLGRIPAESPLLLDAPRNFPVQELHRSHPAGSLT